MSRPFNDSSAITTRGAVFVGIFILHAFLIYLFATGLTRSAVRLVREVLVARVIEEQPTPERVPRVPGPDFETITPTVDPPPIPPDPVEEAPLDLAEPVFPTTITTEAVPTVPLEAIQLLGRNVLPNTQDYYPAALRRLGIEGAANVRACVDERGRLRQEPIIEQSSGVAGLDAGALRVARDGRYARSVRGATPVPNCFDFRIVFKLGADN